MKQAYIVDGIRTPIGKFTGSLSNVRADDLAAFPIKALLKKLPNLNQEDIADVILGCANQAGEDNRNVARMALLLAGLPYSVPGVTVNRLCASGLNAAVDAARAIQVGDGDLYIAGGVEHMTRGPLVLSKSSKAFGRDSQLYDSSFGWRFVNPKMEEQYGIDPMGMTAENVAESFNISREAQDQFALWSQQKASHAQELGRLALEITAVEIPQRKKNPIVVDKDEFIRADTTLEGLAKLRPAFRKDENGSVTAGNASGLNDGACALLLASETGVQKNGLKPKARFVASAVAGVKPKYMGIGPVEATRKALKKANLTMKDIDIIELNEAFAAQALACTRELGIEDNDSRINPNGGAIALGHPLGMSGSRLLLTAMLELDVKQTKYALCTMCIGVGQGMAAIIERCE